MTPMDWQEWHKHIVGRMQAILARWGKASSYEYEDLRRAEVLAMRELRIERAAELEREATDRYWFEDVG